MKTTNIRINKTNNQSFLAIISKENKDHIMLIILLITYRLIYCAIIKIFFKRR